MTNAFPRAHRHTFTKRLLEAANYRQGRERLVKLNVAGEALGKVRL